LIKAVETHLQQIVAVALLLISLRRPRGLLRSLQRPGMPLRSPSVTLRKGWKHGVNDKWFYCLVIWHSYGKSPCLIGKSTMWMAIFHSYVKVSKGTDWWFTALLFVAFYLGRFLVISSTNNDDWENLKPSIVAASLALCLISMSMIAALPHRWPPKKWCLTILHSRGCWWLLSRQSKSGYRVIPKYPSIFLVELSFEAIYLSTLLFLGVCDIYIYYYIIYTLYDIFNII
jgi:hypothetical protein